MLVYSFLIIVDNNVKSVLFCVWLVAAVFSFASKLRIFFFFKIYIFYLIPCDHELQKSERMDLKIEHLIQNGKVNIWLHLQESKFCVLFTRNTACA
jgi:hypothetical protein